MAQIVAIDKDPQHNQAIGDIIAVHDDDVQLTGPGYVGMTIIQVDGLNAAAVVAELDKLIPESRPTWKSSTTEWSLDQPEEKVIWKDTDGKWRFEEKRPKFALNLASLVQQDLDVLASQITSATAKRSVLAKITEKTHLDVANLVYAEDINKVT